MNNNDAKTIDNRVGIIISAPSGGGKSSVTNAILETDSNIKLSISATTRKPRGSEVDGINYFFKTREEFIQMQNEGEFLETAEIYGNLYGTPQEYVYKIFAQGIDMLFDVDFAGASSIKKNLAQKTVSIFIKPPSLEILEERLTKRGEDSAASLKARLDAAEEEIKYAEYYDHVVINDDFQQAIAEIKAIIKETRNS